MRKKGEDAGTPDDRLTYDVPEAGAMLGLSRNASYAAAARGDLPIVRFGKLKKVPKALFHRMLEQIGGAKP
jgi:hypothetical protein